MSNPKKKPKELQESPHPSQDCHDSETHFIDNGKIPKAQDMALIKHYCDMQGICPENFHIYVHHKAKISRDVHITRRLAMLAKSAANDGNVRGKKSQASWCLKTNLQPQFLEI